MWSVSQRNGNGSFLPLIHEGKRKKKKKNGSSCPKTGARPMSVVKIWAWCVTGKDHRYKKMSLLLLTTTRSAKRNSLTNRWRWKMKRTLESNYFTTQYGRISWVKITDVYSRSSEYFVYWLQIYIVGSWSFLRRSWQIDNCHVSPRLNSTFCLSVNQYFNVRNWN